MQSCRHLLYTLADVTVDPSITVITPFFETGNVFERTHLSLLGQSFQQWEWIIVNDASSDALSIAILASIRDADPRIRVVDQPERCGPSAARNLAAKMARAPHLFFLDSDDLIEPTTLEKLLWCLESHPEWAMCKGYTHAFEGQSYISTAGFEDAWLFLDRNPVTLTALVRREVFVAVGGFDATMRNGLEDWDLWLRFASHGYWGHTVPEVLDWYRRRPSHADRWSLWTNSGINRVRRELKRKYSHLFRRGPIYIPEHPFEMDKSLCEDIPLFNDLVPERRVLLLLPSTRTLSVVDPELLILDSPLTVVVLGSSEPSAPSPWPFSKSEFFTLAHFLHLDRYLCFLLYLMRSRKFDRVVIWDCSLTLKLVPLLMWYNPRVSFEKRDSRGTQLLSQTEIGESLQNHNLVKTLASQAVIDCAEQLLLQHPAKTIRCGAPNLQRLGVFGVWLFLLKERLLAWGRWLREILGGVKGRDK